MEQTNILPLKGKRTTRKPPERLESKRVKNRLKTRYHPEYIDKLEAYSNQPPFEYYTNRDGAKSARATKFLSMSGFIAENNLTKECLADWRSLHSGFDAAYRKAVAKFEHILIEGTMTGAYAGIPGIFAMKNLIGWTDKQHIEEIDGTLEKRVNDMDIKELQTTNTKLEDRLGTFQHEEERRLAHQ